MVLVSAMHITAGVWVNDDEPGLLEDALEWLGKLAPPFWKPPADDVAAALSPDPGDYRHHRGGEDNGDAHFKNLLVHHEVVLPVTEGRLDLGPWQAVFYAEFDGRRPKRLVIKVMGEGRSAPGRLCFSPREPSVASVQPLDDHRLAHPAGHAHGLQAVGRIERVEVVEQRGHDPRAGHAERVPEGDRAAERVEPLGVEAELVAARDDLGGERLVELDHVDVRDL